MDNHHLQAAMKTETDAGQGEKKSMGWFHKELHWIIFAVNQKGHDWGNQVVKSVGQEYPVIVVRTVISGWRDLKKRPLRTRVNVIPGMAKGVNYDIWHIPDRVSGFSDFLHELNRRRIVRELDGLISNEDRIVIYGSPTQSDLVGTLKERVSIYLALDDLTVTVTGEPIKGEIEAERQLLSKVDLVFCVSDVLAERLRQRSPSSGLPIHILPNGYDNRLFDPNQDWREPEALRSLGRPRVLIAGYVSERIDWNGIAEAARLRPNWTWVFLGPHDQRIGEKVKTHLGGHGTCFPPVPVTEIPAWISHSDACVVPYRLNAFTLASHPLKGIEYLAMGAPVLSTRIASLECYDGAIEWVKEGDGESYARALDEIANQAGKQEIRQLRRRVVSGDSWGHRVKQFREIVFDAIT